MIDQITKYGIGKRHVETKGDQMLLQRWGMWTPYGSIFLCRVSTLQQAFHDHEASFISFIIKGKYKEQRKKPHEDIITEKTVRWFNYVPHDIYHTVITNNTFVWSIHFMGRCKKSMIKLNIRNKVINSTRIVKVNR